jgi:hypothetical protein
MELTEQQTKIADALCHADELSVDHVTIYINGTSNHLMYVGSTEPCLFCDTGNEEEPKSFTFDEVLDAFDSGILRFYITEEIIIG